jgi:hypothetical protein
MTTRWVQNIYRSNGNADLSLSVGATAGNLLGRQNYRVEI